MKFADYLRKVEELTENQIDNRMKYFEPLGSYERYIKYCRENGIKHELVEEILDADTW